MVKIHPGVGDAYFSFGIDVLRYILVFVLLMVAVDHKVLEESTWLLDNV